MTKDQMPNELDYDQTQDYLTGLVPPRPVELQAMEAYAEQTTFPIVGPAAGYTCYQIARMIGARRICEMGSGYGYSTAWFAHAVHENIALSGGEAGGGVVHHIVWDEELSQRAQQHLGRLGFAHIVQYHIGEAVQVLRELAGPFDLIFNDINKDGYPDSLPAIAEKLRPGGVLIVDNMLWHGRIFDPNDQNVATHGVRELTRLLATSPDWILSVLPIRDGLAVAFKK